MGWLTRKERMCIAVLSGTFQRSPWFPGTGGLSPGCERLSLLCLVPSTPKAHFSLLKTTLGKNIYMYEFQGALPGWFEEWDPPSVPLLVQRTERSVSNEEVRELCRLARNLLFSQKTHRGGVLPDLKHFKS